MNIVILGGSGFIGKALAQHYSHGGHQTITVSRSPLATLNSFHTHYDITLDNHRFLTPLLADADVIFHLASDSTPSSSKLQPTLEGVNNLVPTLALLESLQSTSQALLVFISSGGAIYNHREARAPYQESSSAQPMSYYGAGKLAIENFIAAYTHQTGNSAIIIRPSNVYGPGQIPKKQFGIVPTLFQALQNQQEFQIWGNGKTIRDYLYISDFVNLCEKISLTEWPASTLKTYNAGSGKGYSILEIIGVIESLAGKQLNKIFYDARSIDIPAVVLNSHAAKRDFKWEASVDLHVGLRKSWEWYTQSLSYE